MIYETYACPTDDGIEYGFTFMQSKGDEDSLFDLVLGECSVHKQGEVIEKAWAENEWAAKAIVSAALARTAKDVQADPTDELRRAREAVADLNYLSYEFGCLITDSNGWEDTHSDDWTKVCYGEDGDLDSERVRLALHVRFKPNSAEVVEVYALDLATGNMIGGVAG